MTRATPSGAGEPHDHRRPDRQPIYHLTSLGDWERAREAGEYRVSTLGLTLEEVGFIHCSTASQVAGVANRFYRGLTGLVLLTIDQGRVRPEVRYEAVPDSDEVFPHVYGPLNVDAVVDVAPLEPGPDGAFVMPPSRP